MTLKYKLILLVMCYAGIAQQIIIASMLDNANNLKAQLTIEQVRIDALQTRVITMDSDMDVMLKVAEETINQPQSQSK